MTTRDRVWVATLAHLSRHDSFTLDEVEGVGPAEHRTAVRVWRSMESIGLLERENQGAHEWHRTDRAKDLLNTDRGANAGDSEW